MQAVLLAIITAIQFQYF